MYGFLLSIEIFSSILLIIVVLMQSSKGGGLAGTFGGGNFGAVFGVRRTADFLGRLTTVLAAIFVILSLIINIFFLPGTVHQNSESIIQRSATQHQTVPPPQLPPQQTSSPAASPPGK